MDKTKPCHVVLRKFPTTNLKSTEFESRSKTFFQTSKITKECVIILEKCPITNLKTAQILLDKCPVKDLKIPVVKLKKVTLPSANQGGEKTLQPTKIASKKKKKKRYLRVIPKGLTKIRKERGKPSIIWKSSNRPKIEKKRAKSTDLNSKENNNDTGYASDKENEQPFDNPTLQENENYVVEKKKSVQREPLSELKITALNHVEEKKKNVQREPLSELKIQNAFNFPASEKNKLKNISEQKAIYHNFFSKSFKKPVTLRPAAFLKKRGGRTEKF